MIAEAVRTILSIQWGFGILLLPMKETEFFDSATFVAKDKSKTNGSVGLEPKS